jgi:hypothetical protein
MNYQQKISNQLPNFVSMMESSGVYLKDMRIISDSSSKLEYRVPILTFGIIMGYDFYILERISNFEYCLYQIREGKNGIVVESRKRQFSGDQSRASYENMLREMLIENMSNPNYLSAGKGNMY